MVILTHAAGMTVGLTEPIDGGYEIGSKVRVIEMFHI